MSTVQLKFLGCGDAFGSGGRFQSCILGKTETCKFLVDCGASSLVAMRQRGIDPNDIGIILISNFHGDHFGGLPCFLLERIWGLMVAGPSGLRKKLREVMEVTFPGSSKIKGKFPLNVEELSLGCPCWFGPLHVRAFAAEHPPEDPHVHLRIECSGKVIVYSGDTEWTETLERISRDADLLVTEAYFYEKKIKFHMDFRTLSQRVAKGGVPRVVITHMSEEMLARRGDSGFECADDGKVIEV